MPLLHVENLSHQFGHGTRVRSVLLDVNLRVEAGQVVTVIGPSGSGKSTLLLDCGGMQEPSGGHVRLAGIDFYQQSASRRNHLRGASIGYLFQTLELIPYLSVWQNVRLVPGASSEATERWLQRLGLGEHLQNKPDRLSHGQRQRVALARALVQHPKLLIADEPTGNLDKANTRLVFQILREYADRGGAVLLATHDEAAFRFSDRIFAIVDQGLQEMDAPALSLPEVSSL